MSVTDLMIYTLKFLIPSVFTVLFRIFGLGYKSKGRLVLGLGVFLVYLTVVPMVLITLLGYGQYTHIVSFVMTIGGFSMLIYSNDPPCKTILLMLIVAQMNTVVSVPLNMIRHLFKLSYLTLDILLLVVCPIVYLVGLRLWAGPLRFIADAIQSDLITPILIPVVTTALIYAIPVYPPQNFADYPVYCTLLMLGVELAFFLYYYVLYRNLRQIRVLSKQQLQWELLQREMDHYRSFVQEAKQSRHDLRHHDRLLLEYLETGNVKGAKDYLRTHAATQENTLFREFCSNQVVNGVLRIYHRRAAAQGIGFSAIAEIPDELPLTPPELGGLLGNLLENALEACDKSPKQDREICFKAELEAGSLLVELCNTASGIVEFRDGMPISRKAGGGTGTKSTVATVTKIGGMVVFSQQDNRFMARVILPLQHCAANTKHQLENV